MKLSLPSPGLPGQPMYYVIPAKAAHAALAKKFIDLAESPDVQAEGIVKQFNWYPGIDPQFVQAKIDQASWNKLFTDISPADLSSMAARSHCRRISRRLSRVTSALSTKYPRWRDNSTTA